MRINIYSAKYFETPKFSFALNRPDVPFRTGIEPSGSYDLCATLVRATLGGCDPGICDPGWNPDSCDPRMKSFYRSPGLHA